MLPDRVSNPGPLTYESGTLPIALRGPSCSTLKVDSTVLKLGIFLIKFGNIFLFSLSA